MEWALSNYRPVVQNRIELVCRVGDQLADDADRRNLSTQTLDSSHEVTKPRRRCRGVSFAFVSSCLCARKHQRCHGVGKKVSGVDHRGLSPGWITGAALCAGL
jgi:hypothetical protein